MPKPRTKRGEGKKRKHRDDDGFESSKRQRHGEDGAHEDNGVGAPESFLPVEDAPMTGLGGHDEPMEREFFGMLADDEQEYFRRADEMLELNQFPTTEERDMFLESVFREAQGKELKLASSQSCSRLMERLIQLSNTKQKKDLFNAFADHFLSLVQHRFASHCCEALFLRSAGVVTQELADGGFVMDTEGAGADGENEGPQSSMEQLFLATLDELEGSLTYLITDRFASHTLRVLLLVLSGRPLDDAQSKTLLKSKKKENISVAGSAAANEQNQGMRAVPGTFISAVQKIIKDATAGLDATGLLVLAKHPIGNPTLQLLLELDLTLNKGNDKEEGAQPTLLPQLLPGAPKSLADETSQASSFVNGMIYEQIGSRLIEVLLTHAPGKVFKALKDNIFLPRIHGYVRNDVSSYAAIRILNRLGKDDLVKAMELIQPTVPKLVAKERYNVLKTLFDRCVVRDLKDDIKKLMKGLREGCGSAPADLVTTLCCLKADKKKKKEAEAVRRNEYAVQSHGAQLLTLLLSIPGPAKGVQESLLALDPETLKLLATTSMPTVTLLTAALNTPSANPAFHKVLTNTLLPSTKDLALSQFGHNFINAIIEVPSKGKERNIPFHMKEAIINKLTECESELRNCWMGRSVWRTWKGDWWKTRRGDWKAWAREVDVVEGPVGGQAQGANGVKLGGPDAQGKDAERKGRPPRPVKK